MKDIKVGDKLRLSEHSKDYFIEVLHVGEDTFYGRDSAEMESSIMIDLDWQHYKEEVIKDLEGVFKFYRVIKCLDRITVSIQYGNKESFNYIKGFDSDKVETITEKEAIERGLNV